MSVAIERESFNNALPSMTRLSTTQLIRDCKGDQCMLNITSKSDEEILAFEVTDEALEIAAGTMSDQANFTLGACTGLSECPG